MPNHVYNEVVLSGVDPEAVKAKVLNADGDVDFAVLVPLPVNYWPGSVSIKHREAFPGTHLDAATKMWGTKWGPYENPALTHTEDTVTVTFNTAWGPPRGWVVALLNTFNCQIVHRYLSEGFSNGYREVYTPLIKGDMMTPKWEAHEIDEGTADHRFLHKQLWGVEKFEDE
ncbi:MAG: hypothetical protein AAGK93_00485, partial [Pseudomonadota bacterium]